MLSIKVSDTFRDVLLGGDPGHTQPGVASQGLSAPSGNLAGLDLGQQLQQIVRGELRRMLEVNVNLLARLYRAVGSMFDY